MLTLKSKKYFLLIQKKISNQPLYNLNQKNKLKASRRKEIIKTRAEIDKIDDRKTMKPKAGCLKRSTTLVNFRLDGLREREKTQITKMRNRNGDFAINSTEIKTTIREYY